MDGPRAFAMGPQTLDLSNGSAMLNVDVFADDPTARYQLYANIGARYACVDLMYAPGTSTTVGDGRTLAITLHVRDMCTPTTKAPAGAIDRLALGLFGPDNALAGTSFVTLTGLPDKPPEAAKP
jgi:hypothetical protein